VELNISNPSQFNQSVSPSLGQKAPKPINSEAVNSTNKFLLVFHFLLKN